jgi:Fur family ferric uptake transcriptional regulator
MIVRQNQNLRMTRQRQCILEELRKTRSHPNAEEVCQLVRRHLPRISLGTVYRNLEILSNCGMIQKLELAGWQRRYDGTVENHYHIRCAVCGRLQDLPLETLDFDLDSIRRKTDFEVYSHRLEFFGLCPECKSRGEEAGSSATWQLSTSIP